jgi:hypothetical protein
MTLLAAFAIPRKTHPRLPSGLGVMSLRLVRRTLTAAIIDC